jgi:FkbM family methyltransferase
MRFLWSLPVFRDLRVRRALWNARNALGAVRRALFERLGSDRYSRPALHGMDRKLARHLPHRNGFFVEAGAYDGFIQSNTYWLERFHGWRGVLVEPIPHLWRQARRRRRACTVVNCALVPPEREGQTISMRYGGLMSLVPGAKGGGADEESHVLAGDMHGLDDTYGLEVAGRTLTSVLDEAGAPADIDLLSLDVEGFEAEVLRGLDLTRFRPRFLLVEMDEPERRRREVEAVLGSRYEAVERLSPLDVLYRRTA